MNIRRLLVAALLAASLFNMPASLAAQRPYAWVMQREEAPEMGGTPFAALLFHREALQLARLQIGRIESVRSWLVDRNERPRALIRDAEASPPDDPAEQAALTAARTEFAGNVREAERQVREILTNEQREEATNLIGHESWAYPPQVDREEAAERAAGEALPPTLLVVENHNYYDANIYMISGPRRLRLGFVGGLATRSFPIPDVFVAAPSGLQFEVRQIPTHRLPVTEEVTVTPGNSVYLRIPPG